MTSNSLDSPVDGAASSTFGSDNAQPLVSSADQLHGPPITALPDVQSTPSSSKKAKFLHTGQLSDEAGPSTLPTPNEAGESGEEKEERTPVMNAIPLAEEPSVKEEFYELKMGWSGKIYEIKVGGNDM
jgi:ubiquitin-like domain-containing CTD phosphatase 1